MPVWQTAPPALRDGHKGLRCFSNQPVAEIVQCGEPILLADAESFEIFTLPFFRAHFMRVFL